jgi:glycosyltransferase involved in cell wall biosynthesis
MVPERQDNLDISIIVTALNEEDNIISVIEDSLKAFKDFQVDGEIIVVNDGSIDKTGELVGEAIKKNSCIKMIRHESPQGVGASFWDGVKIAEGEMVSWMPGDNENIPSEIVRYLRLSNDVDIVIPYVYNKRVRHWFRNLLSCLYTFIINTTFGMSINYTNGTVLYRRSVLNTLDYHCSSFFYQTDIIVRLVRAGYLFTEVPYCLRGRKGGRSKAISISSLYKIAKGYFNLVKDIYFKKAPDNKKYKFISDSITFKRYSAHLD